MNNDSLQVDYTNSRAIIIGIDKYSSLGSLSGAVNDAAEFAKILQSEFKFPADQIHLLLDSEASQVAIRERLELVSQQAQKDDRIVFFFAGHGATRRTPNGEEIGHIAAVESGNSQWYTFLSIDDITGYSRFIAAKHVLYIFDACFSGLALKRGGIIGTPSADVKRWIKDCMTHRTRQVLTAGLADQLNETN